MSKLLVLSEAESQFIQQQLGRKPRGIVDIAARSAAGEPIVLTMRAWLDGEPFPTLYWLCSKALHTRINQIETDGFVKSLEAEVDADEVLREQLLADQACYQVLRFDSMSETDRKAIEEKGLMPLFENTGIGGIKQLDKIRCLHMHYAFHLARKSHGGTVVGRILDARFNVSENL